MTNGIRVLATASSCLAAATAAVAAAGERHLKGTDEPRWPGRIHRELGKTPGIKDWEFRGRKGNAQDMTTETSMRLLEAAAELDDRVARLVAAAETALAAARSSGSLDAADPALKSLAVALQPLSAAAKRVHHPKRGHTYVVGSTIEMQISSGPYKGAEGKLVQVYHAPCGKAWGRFVEEFGDGRFVTAAP